MTIYTIYYIMIRDVYTVDSISDLLLEYYK